jgi:hypothetical protein
MPAGEIRSPIVPFETVETEIQSDRNTLVAEFKICSQSGNIRPKLIQHPLPTVHFRSTAQRIKF